jgi:hypothetical protein
MKRLITALFVLVISAQAFAQDKVSVEMSTSWWSEYIYSNGNVGDKGDDIQSNLTVTMPDGEFGVPGRMFFNIWGSKSMDDGREHSFGNEIDLTVGWIGNVGDLKAVVWADYFDLHRLTDADGDVVRLCGEVSKDFKLGDHTLTPFAAMIHNIILKGDDGILPGAGLRHSLPITDKLTLSHSAEFDYDEGSCDNSAAFLFFYSAGLFWDISKNASVGMQFKLFEPLTDTPNDGRKLECAWGPKLIIKF